MGCYHTTLSRTDVLGAVARTGLFPKLTPMVLNQGQVTPPTQQDTQPLGLTEENNPEKGTSYKSHAGGQQEA